MPGLSHTRQALYCWPHPHLLSFVGSSQEKKNTEFLLSWSSFYLQGNKFIEDVIFVRLHVFESRQKNWKDFALKRERDLFHWSYSPQPSEMHWTGAPGPLPLSCHASSGTAFLFARHVCRAELQIAPLGYSEHAPLVFCHKLFSSLTIKLVLRKSSTEPDIPSLPLITKPVLMGAQPSATMRHRRLLPSELTNENCVY